MTPLPIPLSARKFPNMPGLNPRVRGYASSTGPILVNYAAGGSLAGASVNAGTGNRTYRDSGGVLQNATSGVLRDNHYQFSSAPAAEVRTTLIEGAGTNQHLNSTTLNVYTPTTGVVTITPAFGVAPDGTTTTTRFQVDAAIRVLRYSSANCGIDATATQYCVSLFYRGAGATYKGVIAIGARNGTSGTAIYLPYAGTMKRVYAVFTSGGLTPFIDIQVEASADFELWGIQVEKNVAKPSTYMPSGASAGARVGDSLTLAGSWGAQITTRYERWLSHPGGVEYETVTTGATTGPSPLSSGRAYLNYAEAAGTTLSKAFFRAQLGLSSSYSTPPELAAWYSARGGARTCYWVGDSTVFNAAGLMGNLNARLGTGCPFENVTMNYANSGGGATIAFIRTNYLPAAIAAVPTMIVFTGGLNDEILNVPGSTQAQMVTDLAAVIANIRSGSPNTVIILRMPNSLTSDNYGALGYVDGTDVANAQIYTDAMRAAYLSFVGQYPNVYVWDTMSRVFGTTCVPGAGNPKMADMLHPSSTTSGGYALLGDDFTVIAGQ